MWDHQLEMMVDDVWNGFFIYSLLLDHSERDSILQLDYKPHLRHIVFSQLCGLKMLGCEGQVKSAGATLVQMTIGS